MNVFFEKLGSYHILTNLIPGAFFVLSARYLFDINLALGSAAENVVLYYFIGLLVSRVGSMIVTPLLRGDWWNKENSNEKKFCFIKFAQMSSYIKASKVDPKIEILAETNDGFRNLLTCTLFLPFVEIIRALFIEQTQFCMDWRWGAIPLLFFLFLFSYKKRTRQICTRVNKAITELENNVSSVKNNI